MDAATASLVFSTKKTPRLVLKAIMLPSCSYFRKKNAAHAAKLQNPLSTALHQKWKELRSRAQRELRQTENKWWTDKANEIQLYADTYETQAFYDAIKAAYGPRHHSVHPVRAKDGVTLIKDHQGILSRWAEHLSELLNCINPTDPTYIELILQLPIIPCLLYTSPSPRD